MKCDRVIITARESLMGADDGGFLDGLALLALLLGEFDDENAVLGRQRDQHTRPICA